MPYWWASVAHEWLHLSPFGAVYTWCTHGVCSTPPLSCSTCWYAKWHFLLLSSFKVFHGYLQIFWDPAYILVHITLFFNDPISADHVLCLDLSFCLWGLVSLGCLHFIIPLALAPYLPPPRVLTYKTADSGPRYSPSLLFLYKILVIFLVNK